MCPFLWEKHERVRFRENRTRREIAFVSFNRFSLKLIFNPLDVIDTIGKDFINQESPTAGAIFDEKQRSTVATRKRIEISRRWGALTIVKRESSVKHESTSWFVDGGGFEGWRDGTRARMTSEQDAGTTTPCT